jgi:oxygen-dependent protoporphyrinogen oxidase
VVCLGYRRADVGHPLDGYGLVVAETEGLRTTACGFFSTKFPGRAPAGHVLLRGFVGGARDPGAARLSDAELADTVHREMAPTLALAAPPVLVRAFRWPEATPQMLVGHLERVALLERRLATHAGLRVTGAGLRGTGIPDTVGDARRTAAGALDWIRAGDIPSPAYTEAGGPAKSR